MARSKTFFLYPRSIQQKMCHNYILFKVFIQKMLLLVIFHSKSKCFHLFVVVFLCIRGWLGVKYDSQATNRKAAGGREALTGSLPCFLLVAQESNKTPSRMAMYFFYSPSGSGLSVDLILLTPS
jgi:hypothetical protein